MLKLQEEKNSLKTLLLFIFIAYLFSVSIRFIWIQEISSQPSFYWNNEIMINTNDGYAFAEGARDILNGYHNENDLSWKDSAISKLTALLATIFPVSFETLILYMPSFIGSLIVFPLILIGRALNQTTMGFIAALIGSIAHSYYNRTMTGYYDTDMLNIVFPVLEMYSLVLALTHQRNRYLIPITISITLYQWWYPQAYAFDTALVSMIIGYTLLFDRKNLYLYKIALFIVIGILAIPIVSKISLAILVFAFFHFKPEISTKFFWPLAGVIIVFYFYSGGFTPIWILLNVYVIHTSSENTIQSSLHFYNVISTVREAGQIPFTVFAERISGNIMIFLFAFTGYIMAIIAYRPLIITLPLLGLGFLAMSSGLRFTIYAVPVMAIGLAYFILFITQFIQQKIARILLIMLFTTAALYPNYLHIREYIMPTVLTTNEVKALDELGKISSGEDYVVAWWDYGYPIRYYSDVKTWIDGGKHSGDVNYPASYVLTANDPLAAANIMRTYTEATETGYKDLNKTQNSFEYMMALHGFKDPNDFLNSLALPETKIPSKTRDVYLYLPLRMLEIFPTVALFSNLDLTSPNIPNPPFFYATRIYKDSETTLELNQGISIDKKTNTIKLGNQSVPIKSFYHVGYDNSNKLRINEQKIGAKGLSIIFLASYGQFLVLDDYFVKSMYIQMFVFENYNKNLFEPVILDPMTKIYKLKI